MSTNSREIINFNLTTDGRESKNEEKKGIKEFSPIHYSVNSVFYLKNLLTFNSSDTFFKTLFC
jgi:hypothetical protein